MTKEPHDTQASGFAMQAERVLDKPSLLSSTVVSGLIRNAFGRAITRRGDYFAGTAPDAVAQDVADMEALADLLQGADAVRYSVQPWNSEHQMGQHIKDTFGTQCAADKAVFTLLLSVLSAVYRTIDESSSSDIDPSRETEVLLDELTFALLGLPSALPS
jgi:uncharacterized protein YbjT (DUF2867 family)